jgi:DnaJ-class molecular chaperone
MIKHFRILVICILLFNSFYSLFSFAGAAPLFLGNKHKVAGITCDGCHKENPPKEQVPTSVCNKCHGDQEKIAEKTLKIIPNPHGSHLGNQKCELCHHAHKPSEDHCSNCHEFNYKVP